VAAQCEHLATRLQGEAKEVEGQVSRAFVLTLCRAPTAGEVAEFAAHARQYGLASTCRVLINSNEFVFVN
jgi:hypothetical protein